MRIFKVTLLAAGIALSTQPAFARNVVWNFSGTFTFVSTEYQDRGLSPGDVLSGTIQLDTKAKDAYPDDPMRGQYDVSKFTVCVAVLATCTTFSGPRDAHVMTVINDVPDPAVDYFEIYGRDVPLWSTAQPTRLFSFTGRLPVDTFGSDGMVFNPPPPSIFNFINFQYTDVAITSGTSAAGVITILQSR